MIYDFVFREAELCKKSPVYGKAFTGMWRGSVRILSCRDPRDSTMATAARTWNSRSIGAGSPNSPSVLCSHLLSLQNSGALAWRNAVSGLLFRQVS